MSWVEPLTLTGVWARLAPLSAAHTEDLLAVGQSPAVWEYMPRNAFASLADVRAWIAETLDLAANGTQCPFAIINLATGWAVGSTRYMDIVPADRRLEIGWTWLGPEFWRTPLNTECKYLLLCHAFEALNCLRVQLKTDIRNERSQRAIERLGAVREGVLRKHMILALKNNHQRATVMYSITDDEWPAVKARLADKLSEKRSGCRR